MTLEKDDNNSVDILTDARHGWRKNARQTDVVCIGDKTKKVVAYEVVTTQDDPCAQRHELIGTKKVYEQLESKNVQVGKHAHDNNKSITKYVRVSQPETINQLDNWHALKQLEKSVKAISEGAKKNHGKTWHSDLIDKPHAIRTHAYYAMANCNENPETLRSMIMNSIEHYKGNHDACSPVSRCKTEAGYQSRRRVIMDPEAERMLRAALTKCILVSKAEFFVHNMSSAHVESFNNTLNVLHDKRISFGMPTYKMKTAIAVGYWNCGKTQFADKVWRSHLSRINE